MVWRMVALFVFCLRMVVCSAMRCHGVKHLTSVIAWHDLDRRSRWLLLGISQVLDAVLSMPRDGRGESVYCCGCCA